MEAQVKELLPPAAKIAREFENIPALDTLGLLKSGYAAKSGCGVSPQAVLGVSRHQSSSPQVDDFPPQP